MNIRINKSILSGSFTAPMSKSVAIRYFIASTLSENDNVISNVAFSYDVNACLNTCYAFGKKLIKNEKEKTVSFIGTAKRNFEPTFDANESATVLRLMLPVVLTKYDTATFIGKEKLISRGISIYEKVFNTVLFDKNRYCINTKGTISSKTYEVDGSESSQYISGLLFALPLLDGDSKIVIKNKIASINYVILTISILIKFSIQISDERRNKIINCDEDLNNILDDEKNGKEISFIIKGKQKYIASNFSVEGDFSNSAYAFSFNYFGSKINVTGLNDNSFLPEKVYKNYFDKLNNSYAEIDVSNCIDLTPILIVFASMKFGGKFIGTNRLKGKECDRGTVIATELKKCNANIEVFDDYIVVNKVDLCAPNSPFFTSNDHRIAMALTLLSARFDIEINGIECINKSYPAFYDVLCGLGLKSNKK